MKINFIKDRNKYIQELMKNKTVLHYGCIDYGIDPNQSLHKYIEKTAKETIGVEIDQNAIEKYSMEYPNVLQGDVTKKLDYTKNYLKKDGKLIITTPNAYNYRNIFRQFFFNHVVQHEEHTCIFDKETIRNSLERHGYEVTFFSYLYIVPKIFLHKVLDYIFCKLKKSFAPNILVIAKVKE